MLQQVCFFIFIVSIFNALACKSSKDRTTDVPTENQSQSAENPSRILGPNGRDICIPPQSVSGNLKTIEDVTTLINAMPKPVSLACFIDALQRPLYINASSSMKSIQPAISASIPRIFIFTGEALTLTVVPSGIDAGNMEIGLGIDSDHSIKAELLFPVVENLSTTAAYQLILEKRLDRTVCGLCHAGEKPAGEGFPSIAFSSKLLRPDGKYDVPLSVLEGINGQCLSVDKPECQIIQALFFQGPVLAKTYP